MSELNLDEVYEDQEVAAEPEIIEEPVKTETVEATEETTEEVKEPEAEAEESTTDSKEAHGLLTGLMDEREKRQDREKTIEELEAKLAKFENLEEDVSVFTDEKAYTEQQEQKVAERINTAVLDLSRGFAVREFGEEKVAAAEKWYAAEGMKSPYAIDRVHNASDKFNEAVSLFDEEQARIDPDGYRAKVRAEVKAEYEAEKAEASEETTRDPIKQSLASKRSAGKAHVTTEDFEDMLNP